MRFSPKIFKQVVNGVMILSLNSYLHIILHISSFFKNNCFFNHLFLKVNLIIIILFFLINRFIKFDLNAIHLSTNFDSNFYSLYDYL